MAPDFTAKISKCFDLNKTWFCGDNDMPSPYFQLKRGLKNAVFMETSIGTEILKWYWVGLFYKEQMIYPIQIMQFQDFV